MQIKKEQYQQWLDNPVTEIYRQYLKDLAEESRKHQNPDFICRSLDDLIELGARTSEATVQRSVLEELAELTFEDIQGFYEVEQ